MGYPEAILAEAEGQNTDSRRLDACNGDVELRHVNTLRGVLGTSEDQHMFFSCTHILNPASDFQR
ncbi:hypothetical protein BBP40_009469 [Aspergillus hancockii]|nr:hypothetical protein BBP40_009469 [Aspergillus hancockii]